MNPRYKTPDEKLDEVYGFFEPELACPCCQEIWICLEDCTYLQDEPLGYDRMMALRELFSIGKI